MALAAPFYCFGFSAQIKTVFDRFCANSHKLTGGKLVSYINSTGFTK